MKQMNRAGRVAGRVVGLALSATMLATLVACGGGGGASGDPVLGGGGGTGNGGTTVTAKMAVTLSSSTVTSAAPATVSVKVTDNAGNPLIGQVVSFTATGGSGVFSAPSALTDGNGLATVILTPASPQATGADVVTATVTVGGQTITATAGFQLTATDVTISAFTSDLTTLAAYGQTALTVTLTGASSTSPVNVVLTSACASNNRGTITPANVTTTTGVATFTFRDNGCGSVQASDSLQASITGTSATKSLTLPIVSPTVASISFSDATPSTIYLKSSGYTENSNVTFRVRDANGNGVPNRRVVLSASTWAGGLTLDGLTNQNITKTTDANGDVIVRVNSGTVPTPVRVRATLEGSDIATVSSALAIAVGLPSQLNFSLSQGKINIEGYNTDGTLNTYSVSAADRLGNPVPNDTAVNFVAEGGQVQPIARTALNVNGLATATANFNSQEPRPADGRVTVTAYALGEESFVDQNGNNVYDLGEPFQDLGDVYVDRHFNSYYNADQDQFISLGLSGALACNAWTTEPGATLLKLNASIPVKPSSCDQVWGRAYVRRSVVTVFSTSSASPIWGITSPSNLRSGNGATCPGTRTLTTFSRYQGASTPWFGYSSTENPQPNLVTYQTLGSGNFYTGYVDPSVASPVVSKTGALSFYVSDANPVAFNPMPSGTTISATGSDGVSVKVEGGSPVANDSEPTVASVSFVFDDNTAAGVVYLNFTSPGGLTTTVPQRVVKGAIPTAGACP